jgi:hypothetical protein
MCVLGTFLELEKAMRCKLLAMAMVILSESIVSAEAPRTIELKLEGVSVRVSELAVVTGTASSDPRGGPPEKVIPLKADDLLHPTAPVWIQFRYEADFKKGDAPKEWQFLAVAIHLKDGSPWGYQPATLQPGSGTGWIRVFAHAAPDKPVEINEELQLVGYGRTNDGQQKQVVSKETETVRVKFRRDGQVTLSLTQYEELKAGLRRLAELERKVQDLEKRK